MNSAYIIVLFHCLILFCYFLFYSGVHVFVEKPLSTSPPVEFRKYLQVIEKAQKESKAVVSVGYMFR